MRRQAKVGDTVKVQLSNGPLVQAYGQYSALFPTLQDLVFTGKVVRISSGGRMSVQFDMPVVSSPGNERNNSVYNAFGKGRLGYCLYFEAFDKFPYEVIEDEPEMKNVVISNFSEMEASMTDETRNKLKNAQLSFEVEMKKMAEYYKTTMPIIEKFPPEGWNVSKRYSVGFDPYLPAESINMQFVQPLLTTKKSGADKAYGFNAIKARRVGQSWMHRIDEIGKYVHMDTDSIKDISDAFKTGGKENVFGALEYAKMHDQSIPYSQRVEIARREPYSSFLPKPQPFLSDHEKQLLLLCP